MTPEDGQGGIAAREIETPILANPTPEGARDFLVPSRVYKGRFYALPQSPQQFKQTLIVSGFDRYFQIVRCFRDEALRADRQLEFTQIDIETSFIDLDDFFGLNEGLMEELFALTGRKVERPFPRLPYTEAMEKYGSDKPDLRVRCLKPSCRKDSPESFETRFLEPFRPGGFNRHHVLKGLVYFEDADKDPGPEMLVDFSWAETKRFFVAGVGAVSRV